MGCPTMRGNKDVRGVALDGYLKDDEVNLASSTLTAQTSDSTGFVISYVARVKLNLGSMGGDLVADVPFKMMHPPPDPQLTLAKVAEWEAVPATAHMLATTATRTSFSKTSLVSALRYLPMQTNAIVLQ